MVMTTYELSELARQLERDLLRVEQDRKRKETLAQVDLMEVKMLAARLRELAVRAGKDLSISISSAPSYPWGESSGFTIYQYDRETREQRVIFSEEVR